MSKCRVLIVDDIPENVEQVADMLSELDLDIQKAGGGKQAIELIDTFRPHIILLDLMMPAVNGWDVIDHVRANYNKSEMAIIVTSLLNNKDNVDECYELGVNDYIAKPILKARLLNSVENLIRTFENVTEEPVAQQHPLQAPQQPASVVELDPAVYLG